VTPEDIAQITAIVATAKDEVTAVVTSAKDETIEQVTAIVATAKDQTIDQVTAIVATSKDEVAAVVTSAKDQTVEQVTAIVATAKDQTIEAMRDMQTEILRGIEAFARGNFARMHRIETSDADTNARITALEERVLMLETRQRPSQ
jgi:hypothetical protein